MSGSYVAKPAVVAPIPAWPTIPIGWNPDWPFPGPNPPGYTTPDAAISLTSGATVAPGESVNAFALWMASAEDGPVGLPDGEWTQEWSATIGSTPVNLRLSGDTEYSSSLTFNYSDVSGYFGAIDDIEFDITEANDGQTITLSVSSAVDGETYTDTADILVNADTSYVEILIGAVILDGTATIEISVTGGSASRTDTDAATGSGVFATIVDNVIEIESADLATLAGKVVTGTLTATNNDPDWQNEATATVEAYRYEERGGILIGASETQFSILIDPSQTDEETKVCFTFPIDPF